MGSIAGDNSINMAKVPISEQVQLTKYVIGLIKSKDFFSGIDVELNFIEGTRDCVCVRLTDDAYKTEEYVDGSYEAHIRFMVIYRKMNISDSSERMLAMDAVNNLGVDFDNTVEFDCDIDGIEITSITQETSAGLVYRDDSGIEDNGAVFSLVYDRN